MLTIAPFFVLVWQLFEGEALGRDWQRVGPRRRQTWDWGDADVDGTGRRRRTDMMNDMSLVPKQNRTTILVATKYEPVLTHAGGELKGCPPEQPPCFISDDMKNDHDTAAAIVFNARFMRAWEPVDYPPAFRRPSNQRWVFNFFFEPALCGNKDRQQKIRTDAISELEVQSGVDWTIGPWSDADFWQPSNALVPIEPPHEISKTSEPKPTSHRSEGKTSKQDLQPKRAKRSKRSLNKSSFLLRSASWEKENYGPVPLSSGGVAANDNPANGKTMLLLLMLVDCDKQPRKNYWEELSSWLPKDKVQMVGKCSKVEPCEGGLMDEGNACYRDLFAKFKFYAAFENAQCSGYVTEKFWRGFDHGMVPIALGGLHRTDYDKIAPRGSYLHTDDYKSPKELAEHLMELDKNDAAYNAMFDWRKTHVFAGAQVLVKPYCELCAELHKDLLQQKARRFEGGRSLHKWFYEDTCRAVPGAKVGSFDVDGAAEGSKASDNDKGPTGSASTAPGIETGSGGYDHDHEITSAEEIARWYGWGVEGGAEGSEVGNEDGPRSKYSDNGMSQFERIAPAWGN